ncbi:transglutaminase-like domain-containing protein [Sphingomonas sp. PB4P5]|uniref:transglutaminase-like domain-containing protein n=1 Tax=Parasphingomonas puruogangriensis TaxID=3096155 RepID=UPI003FA74F7B
MLEGMVMRLSIDVALDYWIDDQAEVLLQIEAAAMVDQHLEHQDLRIYCMEPLRAVPGEDAIGQRTWAKASGSFCVEYQAVVKIDRAGVDFSQLPATDLSDLPGDAVPYLMPSRYCESERFEGFVQAEFDGLSGGALAAAIGTWVHANLTYQSGSSSGITTALMTFADRRGVCRDYAHLVVALARAGGIPARCVSAYAPGVSPPDFHAVAELWLDGGWHLIDATGMAKCDDLIRVAVGRDATDIAFMTVFGTATMNRQSVFVKELADDDPGFGAGTPAPDDRSTSVTAERGLAMDSNTIDQRALDSLSVAPPNPDEDDSGHIQHPRQDAGQDKSIAARLERDPENSDARLDAGLDESMDASDPPAATQPVHNNAPPESSGFDAEAEAKLQADKS